MVRSRPLILPVLCLLALAAVPLAPARAEDHAPARNAPGVLLTDDRDEAASRDSTPDARPGGEPDGDTAPALEFFWSGSIMARDPARPLISDIDAFETFFRSTWTVTAWRFEDWRETSVPSWRFEVDLNEIPGLEGLSVHGFIPENRRSIRFEEDGCEYFTLDFVRRFVQRFPDQADNMIFFNEYDEVTVFEPGLDEPTLLARIRLETPLAENEASRVLDPGEPEEAPDAESRHTVPEARALAALPPRDLLNENALLLLAWRSIWPPSLDGDMSAVAGQYRGPWPLVEKPRWLAPCEISPDRFAEMQRQSPLLHRDGPPASDQAPGADLATFLNQAFPERFAGMRKNDLEDWILVRLEEARARGFGDDEALVYWPVLAAIGGDDFARIPYVDLWLRIDYLARDDLLDRLLRSANLSLCNPWVAALLSSVREDSRANDPGPDDTPDSPDPPQGPGHPDRADPE